MKRSQPEPNGSDEETDDETRELERMVYEEMHSSWGRLPDRIPTVGHVWRHEIPKEIRELYHGSDPWRVRLNLSRAIDRRWKRSGKRIADTLSQTDRKFALKILPLIRDPPWPIWSPLLVEEYPATDQEWDDYVEWRDHPSRRQQICGRIEAYLGQTRHHAQKRIIHRMLKVSDEQALPAPSAHVSTKPDQPQTQYDVSRMIIAGQRRIKTAFNRGIPSKRVRLAPPSEDPVEQTRRGAHSPIIFDLDEPKIPRSDTDLRHILKAVRKTRPLNKQSKSRRMHLQSSVGETDEIFDFPMCEFREQELPTPIVEQTESRNIWKVYTDAIATDYDLIGVLQRLTGDQRIAYGRVVTQLEEMALRMSGSAVNLEMDERMYREELIESIKIILNPENFSVTEEAFALVHHILRRVPSLLSMGALNLWTRIVPDLVELRVALEDALKIVQPMDSSNRDVLSQRMSYAGGDTFLPSIYDEEFASTRFVVFNEEAPKERDVEIINVVPSSAATMKSAEDELSDFYLEFRRMYPHLKLSMDTRMRLRKSNKLVEAVLDWLNAKAIQPDNLVQHCRILAARRVPSRETRKKIQWTPDGPWKRIKKVFLYAWFDQDTGGLMVVLSEAEDPGLEKESVLLAVPRVESPPSIRSRAARSRGALGRPKTSR